MSRQKAFPALRRLAPLWYYAWFKRSHLGPDPTPFCAFPHFTERARMGLYDQISRDECETAHMALLEAGWTQRSASMMYAFADYFGTPWDAKQESESRGVLWREDLSRALEVANDEGAKKWAEELGVLGAMFFPHEKSPHAWRTLARRLLRKAGLTGHQVAVIETALLFQIGNDPLAEDWSKAHNIAAWRRKAVPEVPLPSIHDPIAEVVSYLAKRESALRQGECSPKHLQDSPRLLGICPCREGFRFVAVNRGEAVPEGTTTFEPLGPVPAETGPPPG